jgi:hypothetical protein
LTGVADLFSIKNEIIMPFHLAIGYLALGDHVPLFAENL